MELNEISKIVLDAAIAVHKTLGGPGLLESVYQDALVYELGLRGLKVEKKLRFLLCTRAFEWAIR